MITVKIRVFWVVTPCSLLPGYQHSGWIVYWIEYCTQSSLYCSPHLTCFYQYDRISCYFLILAHTDHEKRRRYVDLQNVIKRLPHNTVSHPKRQHRVIIWFYHYWFQLFRCCYELLTSVSLRVITNPLNSTSYFKWHLFLTSKHNECYVLRVSYDSQNKALCCQSVHNEPLYFTVNTKSLVCISLLLQLNDKWNPSTVYLDAGC